MPTEDGAELRMRRTVSVAYVRYPLLSRLVFSMKFECVCAFFIILNCAFMGLEAHDFVTNEFQSDAWIQSMLNVAEHFSTAFFLVELILRFRVLGISLVDPYREEGRANLFDAAIVILTCLILGWLVPLVALIAGFNTSGSFFRSIMLLRALRLARLVRVFRKVPLFREAWMLIRGLSDSVRTLFWTIVVILFVTYVFAVFGLMLVVAEIASAREMATDPAEVEVLDGLWKMMGGIDKLMYTLIQVLAGDSFHSFMRPLLIYIPWSWLYWYAYMGVAVFVLMNLVTAVIVENAFASSANDFETAAADKAAKQKKELKELQNLFALMDTDGDGRLSWTEFRQSFDDPFMQPRWTMLDFQAEEGKELFALLDDGDCEIETAEFFEGLTRMKGSAQAKDVYKLQKSINKLRADMQHILPPVFPEEVKNTHRTTF